MRQCLLSNPETVSLREGKESNAMPSGTVKWFNPDKGFGFIESPGIDDVFIHASALPYGESVSEGDQVEFSLERGPRGTNATEVQILQRSEAPPRPRTGDGGGARRSFDEPTVDPSTLPLMSGSVSRYDSEKGFGFIQPDDQEEQVFFHRSVAPSNVASGDRVTFRLGAGPKGPRAEQVDIS